MLFPESIKYNSVLLKALIIGDQTMVCRFELKESNTILEGTWEGKTSLSRLINAESNEKRKIKKGLAPTRPWCSPNMVHLRKIRGSLTNKLFNIIEKGRIY